MSERWKDIPGYEGSYQVSDCGRVRSLDRVDSSGKKRKGKVLKQISNPGGYLQVVLSQRSQTETKMIHRLVCDAFIGPCPEGEVTRHGTEGQKCNHITNLCHGTPKENGQDTVAAGNTCAKAVIRSDGKKYRSLTEAAADVGCFNSEICSVCKGRLRTAGGYGWRYA